MFSYWTTLGIYGDFSTSVPYHIIMFIPFDFQVWVCISLRLVSVKWHGTLSIESIYISISLLRPSNIIISLCRPFMMVCRTQGCTHSVRAHCDDCRVNRKSCDFFAVWVEVALIFKLIVSQRFSLLKQSRCRQLTSRYTFASQCDKNKKLKFRICPCVN